MRDQPDPVRAIGLLLEVNQMDPIEALQTKHEIENFVESGNATFASQLIHTASLRRHPPRERLRS